MQIIRLCSLTLIGSIFASRVYGDASMDQDMGDMDMNLDDMNLEDVDIPAFKSSYKSHEMPKGHDTFEDESPSSHGIHTSMDTPSKKKSLPEKLTQEVYQKPGTANLPFAQTFDNGDVFSKWIVSSAEKFKGKWSVTKREIEALIGDHALAATVASSHHAISIKLDNASLTQNKGKHIVFSYEVNLENLRCGGAYVKLFDANKLKVPGDMKTFDNETPYVVMFGPDYCGATDKVHLIIKSKNPVSGTWTEHHLASPPKVTVDPQTHAYAFHLAPDNTYEVFVDGVVVKNGSMHTDFSPPFTPSKLIVDPNDKKPADWVDEAKIPDPKDTKPEDWDENEPVTIPDSSATKPEGWREDLEATVLDADDTPPANWNEEKEWVPKSIPNPLCKGLPGCGQWQPPLIANPAHKGKWVPSMIDNPDYKGEWKPANIKNPEYYECKNPHAVDDITALGIEIWTVEKGTMFDNIVISRDIEAVQDFINKTWSIRSRVEKQQSHEILMHTEKLREENSKKRESKTKNTASEKAETNRMTVTQLVAAKGFDIFMQYPAYAGGVVLGIFVAFIWLITRMMPSAKQPVAETEDSSKTTKSTGSKTQAGSTTTEGEELKSKRESTPTTRKRGVAKQDS